MALTLTLTFMSGSRDGEVVQLEIADSSSSVYIGRNAPCEFLITDDPDLSRRHARIFRSGACWMLEDLNSSNGVFLGEFQGTRRLSGASALEDCDIFRVGLTRLRLGCAKNDSFAIAGMDAAVAKR